MEKTLLLQGMTTGAAVGDAGIAGAIDITAPVVGVYPEIAESPVTEGKYSTILVETTPEGGFKFLVNRKVHINKYNTTDAIHKDGSVGGATIGAVTTAGFKTSKKDKFEFEMDNSWDAGQVYDKKKDPKVTEGKLIDDLGSLNSDLREEKAADYYAALDAGIDANGIAVDIAGNPKYSQYVSSRDGKTYASPKILDTLALTTPTDKAGLELNAAILADKLWEMASDQKQMGQKGSAHEGFPYGRSGRTIGAKFTIKDSLIPLMSHDERFIMTGASEEQLKSGKPVAMINGLAIVLDAYMDTTATKFDVELSGTGRFSPVIKGEELPEAFELYDHPTKKTRASLLEGSGGWSTFVTPYINMSRFLKVNITAAPAKAGN